MPRARKPGSGGSRTGTNGKVYTNRTDLNQPARAVPGQTYGQAGAQLAAQQAIPLPGPGASAQAGMQQPPPAVSPGQHGPITAPSNQPSQPITAGLPTGPGPGPEALAPPPDTTINILRGMYAQNPSPDILSLITEAQARGIGASSSSGSMAITPPAPRVPIAPGPRPPQDPTPQQLGILQHEKGAVFDRNTGLVVVGHAGNRQYLGPDGQPLKTHVQ